MSFYRRARFLFNALRRAIPRTPIHKSTPRISRHPSSFYSSKNSKVSGVSSISSQIRPKGGYPNPFFGGTRRCYNADRGPPPPPPRWFQNPRGVLTVAAGTGVLITAYYGISETIPYTNRNHFVLLPRNMEKEIGEAEFEELKETLKEKILAEKHPHSVRVRLITNEIVKALQRGLSRERAPWYAALMEIPPGKWWRKDDEIVVDKRVHRIPKEAQERGSSGLEWEVLVVSEPDVNAFCLPAGKIVVFTGMLQFLKTDAEIATIIGHEVGHVVARHAVEGITIQLWVVILKSILKLFITMPNVVQAISNLLITLPFSRRMEMEADYIGMLLMASAGYDPRIAPKVHEKLGKMDMDLIEKYYFSTHPYGKMRAQLLSQAKVMEEAMTLYWEARAGREIQGFL